MSFVRAAVVDDDEAARKAVCRLLTSLADDMRVSLECREFSSGVALTMEHVNDLDILFIDIDMPHVNGIETVAEVRKLTKSLVVVFVSAYEGYALDSYSVHAQRYLLKPVSKLRFNREIAPLIKEIIVKRDSVVSVKCTDGIHVVAISDIVYVSTTSNKTLLVRTDTEKLETRGSLSTWEESLPHDRFARCHSGFLLNLSFVKRVATSEVVLTTEEAVPLSKHRRHDFLQSFTSYIGRSI